MGNTIRAAYATSRFGSRSFMAPRRPSAALPPTPPPAALPQTPPPAERPVVSFVKSSEPKFFDLTGTHWAFYIDGVKFQSFEQFLAHQQQQQQEDVATFWRYAECTVNGVRQVHPGVRLVHKCQGAVTIHSTVLNHFLETNCMEKVGDTDFLKYDKGCFAAAHVDRLGEYTCLVFPKQVAKSTGGELNLHVDVRSTVTFVPHTYTIDTMIIFPANMEHEVLPVTSGERYVFKVGLMQSTPQPVVRRRRFNCNLD